MPNGKAWCERSNATAPTSAARLRPRKVRTDAPQGPNAKRITTIVLRRLWALLPKNWTPWAYSGMRAATSLFPAGTQLVAQRFFGRLLAETTSIEKTYPVWISFYEQTGANARRAATAHIARLLDKPLISILMPVFDPRPDHLRAAIASVREQFYTRWELCIADYSSADPAVAALLN